MEPLNTLPNDCFRHWGTDNLDHNLATLDSKGTFHGMRIIASVTPSGRKEQISNMRRLKKRCLVTDDIIEFEVAKDFKPYMTDLQIRVQNVSCEQRGI